MRSSDECRSCDCQDMVPFQEVLSEVRRVLEEADPGLLPSLLAQLLDAQVFSVQYYQSLFQDADSDHGSPDHADDLARKLALPMWQKWEASKGILVSMLVEKENPRPDISEEDENINPGLWELIPDTLLSTYIDTIDLSSPEFEESFEFSDDVFDFSEEVEDMPTLVREDRKKQARKRRDDGAKKKPPRIKRQKGGSSATENNSPESFQPSAHPPPQQLVRVPFAFATAAALNSGPTLQILQTVNHFSHSVINQIVPVGSTYVLVSPQSLGPVSHVLPISPADGAVAPLELSMSAQPTVSLSDTASKGWFPSALMPITPEGHSPNKMLSEDSSPPPHGTKNRANPVIPKHIEDYIGCLKSHLMETFSKPQAGTNMSYHYIDTLLVPRKLVIRTGKNANKCLEKELVVLSDVERRKAMVDRSHVFPDCVPRSRHLVTVLGKAGMGKSMLLRRLALDWAGGGLPQFHFVFLLDCKALDLTRPRYSLKSLLLDLSASPHCENSEAVFQHVLSCPEKVLIIFDSFDDMKDLEGLLQASADSASADGYSVRKLFSGLFQRKILAGCSLLIASRPKDVLNQLLRKVDSILELCPFSPTDIERYVSNYFVDASRRETVLGKIRSQKYTFSMCSNPMLCWFTCFLLERHDMDACVLPSTFTELCWGVICQHLELEAKEQGSKPDVTQLCSMAWKGFKSQSSLLNPDEHVSKEVVDYGLSCRILTSRVVREEAGETSVTHFANLFIQSLLSALLLVQSSDLSEKTLVAQTVLQHRKRKPQGEWHDILQRFIMGLLYQETLPHSCGFPQSPSASLVKRQAVEAQLEVMKPAELTPGKLLELFHCVYETGSVNLAKLLIKNLPEDLSFCGAQLSLADACVVEHLLGHAKGLGQTFAINLQDTCVPISGLKDLVALSCIKSYRASTVDSIDLWEHLHHCNDELSLKSAIRKFTIEPFKASEVCNVENLALLVQIHREKRLPKGGAGLALEEGIPAVRHLSKLDYELGQLKGPVVFLQLVELLPALPSLQHLDLENNKIGDSGAENLAGVLPSLTSLKMLNLSQNFIGDAGLGKLAQALPDVSSLQSLSLYGNLIADSGAENLAMVLPNMKSLLDLDVKYNKFTDIGAEKLSNALKSSSCMKTLQMWNGCIPYGTLERLQLQDSRIKALL